MTHTLETLKTGETGVVVLYNHSETLGKGEPKEMLAELGVIACAKAVAEALESAGYRVEQVPIRTNVESAIAPYPPHRWVVFNLAEGLDGLLFEEPRMAWALESMGYIFTGSGGEAIARSLHKAHAKELLAANGANTPPWWLFRHADEVQEGAGFPFPLIVKPVAEDASLGIGPGAIVHDVRELRERTAYVVEAYHQAALAEMFVDGREFNVSMWGHPPETLPLAEIDFSAFSDPYERIVSFAAKWEEESFEYNNTPVRYPALETALAERIRETARRAWAAIGCRGYARVDMRVDGSGTPYVVEVNCNPDISPDAGFYRAVRQVGYDYERMATRILGLALEPIHREERGHVDYGNRKTDRRRRPVHTPVNGRNRRLQPDRVGLR